LEIALMEFTLDIPWPWSLSPVDALRALSGGVLPSWTARVAVTVLAVLLANLTLGGSGLFGLLRRPADGEAPKPVRGVLLSAAFGLLVWMIAHQSLLVLVALFVIYFTLITYKGSARGRGWRLAAVIALRLVALLLTVFTIARPAVGFRTEIKVPSDLIIAIDLSESMTFKDEFNNQTRIEAVRAILKKCEPILEDLKNDHQITVYMSQFAGEVADYDPAAPADGKRSDYGNMLDGTFQRFGSRPNLRGLLIIGDGADNGFRFDAAREAAKWRAVQCPINCFATGNPTPPGSTQLDLVAASLTVEPAPVYVKGRMLLRATVHAFGCENAKVQPHVFIDDKEIAVEKIQVNREEQDGRTASFPLTEKNELLIETTAPPVPGEVRVTLKLPVLPGEISGANNEISTYATIVKEGVSVLLVDAVNEESKYIRLALASDPRIRLFQIERQTEARPEGAEADLLNLERQGYDVIILGNVSAKRLAAGNPQILEKIRTLVREKGVGFMMTGGQDSFGGTPDEDPRSGDWANTPIADILPVELNVSGQIKTPSEMIPTEAGLNQYGYLLRLGPTEKATKDLWQKLFAQIKFEGINRLARPKAAVLGKPGAALLASTEPDGRGEPVLVAHGYGKGRVLAFAANTTYRWTTFGLPDSTEGVDIHARFWKQTVIWLAQQENSEGSVWVKPDVRRLPAGGKESFSVGVRGKTGLELKGGKFEVKVIGPDGSATTVPTALDAATAIGSRGHFWKTDRPGEYRIEVSGTAADVDGKPVTGKASVRFLVYQDESEMMNQAADVNFLGGLSAAGGGKPQSYRIDDLPEFLRELKSARLPNQKVKTRHFPDWRTKELTPFLPILLLLFTGVLGLEWGLRRMWGMV
jgi:uncharacterized membrane protein